jgi:DNA polymerase-3 subunit epsilon
MLEGFSALALKTWPYNGPIALIEKNHHDESEKHLIVDNWCVLGIGDSSVDYEDILATPPSPQIDKDTYRYLVGAIFSKKPSIKIQPLFIEQNSL